MEPRIQYAKTKDGVNIAYAVFGEGPPIVGASNVWGSLHLMQAPVTARLPTRALVDDLVARARSLVLYDGRGSGSSDRDVTDFSLAARVRDLESVVGRVGLDRFPLTGSTLAASTAVAYAVNHPDRVSHLILSDPFAAGADFYSSIPAMAQVRAMRVIAEDQWQWFTLSLANAVLGFSDSEEAAKLAIVFREGMSSRAYLLFHDDSEKTDVTGLLADVRVPTLVARNETSAFSSASLARTVAAGIPNAHFVTTKELAGAICEFLGDAPVAEPRLRPAPTGSGMTAILFADIADSTALTERLGDAAFRAKARDLDAALRTVIHDHSGTPIEGKLLGDGVLAVFTSARQAIEAALACGKAGNSEGLPLHLGLHAGDVIREDNNIYGGAVNIASRISGLSSAGEVLVSETVRSLARTSAGVRFEDRGRRRLKGVQDPLRVWAVRQRA